MEVKLLLGRPTFNLRIQWLRVRAAPGALDLKWGFAGFENGAKEDDDERMKKNFVSRLAKPDRSKRIWEKILSYLYAKQWILLIAKDAIIESPSWNQFTPLMPPSDRIWADPFVWPHEGKYFIFCEEKLYAADRGHIACLTLDSELNYSDNCVVLERPYHLSYPFLFEYSGQLYMIPETEKNQAIELYGCASFPDQWVFVRTMIPNIKAVDATLLEAHGKWWLFANTREGVRTWDTLHLFYADSPLSNEWKSHPRNPVVKDIRTARPAGRIFSHNGSFIRPSQDCSVRYGYAINFNRIAELTNSDYAETHEWSLEPPARKNILATHTWNEAGGLTAIDALIRRFRR